MPICANDGSKPTGAFGSSVLPKLLTLVDFEVVLHERSLISVLY